MRDTLLKFYNTSWKSQFHQLLQTDEIRWLDLLLLATMFTAGFLYLHDPVYWGVAWIGDSQYGDAEFWWNGALHISQGLFHDNPGNGFRPGYFFLTGLTLPVLGEQFQQFYPYFLLAFLSTASLFYLALRQLLGRWIAIFAVSTLIFNPFTAEWLATSTTDGTGMLLNLLSLTCLLFGVNKSLNRSWLIAFGCLFSLATLTRPLVTPFIGIAVFLIFFTSKESFKKRLYISICILIAFCIPTLLWMSIQKLTIDRWSLSSNDASAFYAASDPNIQVWNPSMYNNVQKIAANHYHVELKDVDERMLNQIFWQETIKNYMKYPRYHLERAFPHFLKIAFFSPDHATHGTVRWQITIFEAIVLNLLLSLLIRREFFYASTFITIGVLIFIFPKLIGFMMLAGAILGLIKKNKNSPLGMLLSAYWLTGVVALYFVGGTWGPPSFSHRFALNALGYRLGTQFFFVGDILAAYFLIYLAHAKLGQPKLTTQSPNQALFSQPPPLAGRIVMGAIGAFFIATMITYIIGGSIVAHRVYSRNRISIEPYPSLSPIIDAYKYRSGAQLIYAAGNHGGLDTSILSKSSVKTGKSDVIFTGTVSPFIWNLSGQKRSQVMIYAQNNTQPVSMGPNRIFVEIPQHLNSGEWIGKQGAFIIRNIPDGHNKSNLPYYLTVPVLRAFIPLASDHRSFALSKTTWFPLVKNASQLETNNELKAPKTKITWALDSGNAHFKRRFFMTPQHAELTSTSNGVELVLDTTTILGPSVLSFSYAIDDVSALKHPRTQQGLYDIKIFAISQEFEDSVTTLLLDQNSVPRVGKSDTMKNIIISIPNNTKAIRLVFNNLVENTGVWVYEFNLSVADLEHQAMNTASF